jgi:hypothetical protein
MTFAQPVNLSPGINVITVVRRDGPNGEELPTPKHEFLEDGEFAEE